MKSDQAIESLDAGTVAVLCTIFFTMLDRFESHSHAVALAQVFCLAVRDGILDELEDLTGTLMDVPLRVAQRLHESTPSEVREVIASLPGREFVDVYRQIRALVATKAVSTSGTLEPTQTPLGRQMVANRLADGSPKSQPSVGKK